MFAARSACVKVLTRKRLRGHCKRACFWRRGSGASFSANQFLFVSDLMSSDRKNAIIFQESIPQESDNMGHCRSLDADAGRCTRLRNACLCKNRTRNPARRRAGADTQLPQAGLVQDHQLCLWSNMFLSAIFRQLNLSLPFCKPGFVLL